MKPFGSFLVGGMTREEFLGEPDLIEFPPAETAEVGVIYDPMRDELFAARRGGGGRLDGVLLHASGASSLASSSASRI